MIRNALISVVVAVCLACSSPVDAAGLRAGVSKTDITPKKPVKLAGYASRKDLSQSVHDPLSVRVIAFENDGRRLVLVAVDVLGFYNGTAEYLREAILSECKLEPSELFLGAIHTHSGPTLTVDREKGHPNNVEYTEQLRGTLVQVVREALDSQVAVSLGVGRGHCPVGANRRELRVSDNGESSIVLGRNPNGLTDKEVLVIALRQQDGEPLAVAFDYATHATCLGAKNYAVSGDVMGLAEQFVERILGPDVIAPALAGASGNIDPWFRVLPGFNEEPGWIPEPVLLGTLLGEEVVHVFRSIRDSSTDGRIDTAIKTLELPCKATREGVSKTDKLVVTVGRVGQVAFVGLGCEALTEIGMAIKAGSPYEYTAVITHCNGASWYLAPKHLHVEGGYEIGSSPFAPGAADIVVREVVRMLHDL